MVTSMVHKVEDVPGSPIGAFESTLLVEASSLWVTEVGPSMKSDGEADVALGLEKITLSPIVCNLSPIEVGLGDPTCSGPNCPPGFEGAIELVGLPKRDQVINMNKEKVECQNTMDEEDDIEQSCGESQGSFHSGPFKNCDCANSLVERKEDDQRCGEAHGSFSNSIEKVPQTPIFDSASIL